MCIRILVRKCTAEMIKINWVLVKLSIIDVETKINGSWGEGKGAGDRKESN